MAAHYLQHLMTPLHFRFIILHFTFYIYVPSPFTSNFAASKHTSVQAHHYWLPQDLENDLPPGEAC
jgi:hypothetical protein